MAKANPIVHRRPRGAKSLLTPKQRAKRGQTTRRLNALKAAGGVGLQRKTSKSQAVRLARGLQRIQRKNPSIKGGTIRISQGGKVATLRTSSGGGGG